MKILYILSENNFYWYVDLNDLNKTYKFSFVKSQDCDEVQKFIHIKETNECEIDKFNIIEKKSEESQKFKMFPKDLGCIDSEVEFIILCAFIFQKRFLSFILFNKVCIIKFYYLTIY